jgi:hypothetical protein
LKSPSFKDIRILEEKDSKLSEVKIESNEDHVKFENMLGRS